MGAWLAKSLTPRIKDSYIAQCCVTDFERKKQAHEAQHSDSPRLIKDLSQSKDLSTFSEPEVDTCTKEGYLLTRDALVGCLRARSRRRSRRARWWRARAARDARDDDDPGPMTTRVGTMRTTAMRRGDDARRR